MKPEPVQRRRTVKKRAEALVRRFRKLSRGQQAVFLAALALIIAGGAGLILYGASLHSAGQTAQELREVNTAAFDTPEAGVPVSAGPAEETQSPALPADVPEESPAPVYTFPADMQTETVAPAARKPAALLPEIPYPGNPGKNIGSRFQALRKKNADIVGWLKMGGMVDEAVVQRDNVFYLDHDTLGKQNINGALFLDAGVSLNTRPYTYIIYGHNMRAGAEFGSLRNYENRSFYRSDPFISFDTMYENGRYVVFSVGNVSLEEGGNHYVDFFAFLFNNAEERRRAVDALTQASIYPALIDVQPEDQLLLLVTCTAKDSERRVIAARRVREDETESGLARIIAGGL